MQVELSPSQLLSPDGTVTAINRQFAEVVTPGDDMLEISSDLSAHIAGYLRQPVQTEPKPITPAMRTSA